MNAHTSVEADKPASTNAIGLPAIRIARDRTCSTCVKPIGRRNRSGLCPSCVAKRNNADPAIAAKRAAAIRARFADPDVRAAQRARCIEMSHNLTDAVRESRRRHGKLKAPALIAAGRLITPEMRAENGLKRSDTVLAWCPPEWRDKYRDLKKRGRRAADAKRIVLDLIAGRGAPVPYAKQKAQLAWCPPDRRDEYARLRAKVGAAEARRIVEASLTPFERQLARVAAGARLITVQPLRRPDPSVTLGGVASGLL